MALRREALLDAPLAFAASPEDDLIATAEAAQEQLARAHASVVLGAFAPELVGIVGLYRDPHRKARHHAHLWGMYVSPAHRRRGVGAELLGAALLHARYLPAVRWVQLEVSTSASAALRLYERLGFRGWGTQPEALRHQGVAVDQHHLALRLEPEEPRP